ncbi:MAG: exodeoxyribonuclease VII large subunit [Proteobacteria bacterium]|nr:exodeoxyribonuclease VII large subunit [Pseudomonadota bacterium]
MDFIDDKTIYTVQQLNQATRSKLEESFQLVWVKGELSNVALPRSGHVYFTLKDRHAQVRCAMFKGSNRHLNFTPSDGMAVLVRAAVSIYEERGDYQLIVTYMQADGQGILQQAFEALKTKLQKEQLFEQIHKKPFPIYPKHIGVITSHTGAAIQDILSVLKRRFAISPITIYHTQVQGKAAANDIVKAIQLANKHQKADVLILARGGGSMEDLWCFNEEVVARAIFASLIPIVTGIGHEVDFTIADFVADLRAPTPSAAAQMITPDSEEIMRLIEQKKQRLIQAMLRKLHMTAQKLDALEKQLIHPKQMLQQAYQLCAHKHKQLWMLINQYLERSQSGLSLLSARLQAISPLATLSRGYAIVTTLEGSVLNDVKDLIPQQEIQIRLAQGNFSAIVKKIN